MVSSVSVGAPLTDPRRQPHSQRSDAVVAHSWWAGSCANHFSTTTVSLLRCLSCLLLLLLLLPLMLLLGRKARAFVLR